MLFEPYEIGQDYKYWQKLKNRDITYPLRFGQYFINMHHIEGHSDLFNETNPIKALAYIQMHLMNSVARSIYA